MARYNKIRIEIGVMKTGKTFFLKNILMKEWIEARRGRVDERVLIIDAEDNVAYRDYQIITPGQLMTGKWERGVKRMLIGEDDGFELVLAALKAKAWNMMLVFEDTTNYLEPNFLPEPFRRFCVNCKNRNVDLVFMFHAWGFIHCNLMTVADYIHIFYSGDSAERKKKYISKFDETLRKDNEVKEEYERFEHLPEEDPRRYPRRDVKLK